MIEKAITERTRAVYVVHTYGTAARMERICAVAKRRNLAVIEDVAHAPFYRYRGRQLGTWGDFAVYSFTKKIVNYEGGAIGTNDTAVFTAMMRLREELQAPRALSRRGTDRLLCPPGRLLVGIGLLDRIALPDEAERPRQPGRVPGGVRHQHRPGEIHAGENRQPHHHAPA